MCKFVVEELHENLSNGQYNKGCLLYCMVSVDFLPFSPLTFLCYVLVVV